jgi:hypothetical protein
MTAGGDRQRLGTGTAVRFTERAPRREHAAGIRFCRRWHLAVNSRESVVPRRG